MSPTRRPLSDAELLELLEHRRPAADATWAWTVPEAFAAFLEGEGLGRHTVREHVHAAQRFAAWCAEQGNGRFTIERDLRAPAIEDFLHHEEFFGLSPATISSMLAALRHLAAWARSERRITSRRADAIEHLHRAREEEAVIEDGPVDRDRVRQTKVMVRAMLEAARRLDRPQERAVLATALLAGLSPLELPGLWRADLAGGPPRLSLRVPLDPHRAARTVPLAAGVERILREALERRRDAGLELLRGARGPLDAAEVRRIFARHAGPLGVEPSFGRVAFPRLYLAAHPRDRSGLKAILGIDGQGATLAAGSRRLATLQGRVEEALVDCLPG